MTTKSTIDLVDPQLVPLVGLFPDIELSLSTLAQARADSDARSNLFLPPPIEPVRYLAAGREGAPDVPVLVFKPADEKLRPAILHIHGGGMVMGSAYGLRSGPSNCAAKHDIVVVSVDYRLAPEAPFPVRRKIATLRLNGCSTTLWRLVSIRRGSRCWAKVRAGGLPQR